MFVNRRATRGRKAILNHTEGPAQVLLGQFLPFSSLVEIFNPQNWGRSDPFVLSHPSNQNHPCGKSELNFSSSGIFPFLGECGWLQGCSNFSLPAPPRCKTGNFLQLLPGFSLSANPRVAECASGSFHGNNSFFFFFNFSVASPSVCRSLVGPQELVAASFLF